MKLCTDAEIKAATGDVNNNMQVILMLHVVTFHAFRNTFLLPGCFGVDISQPDFIQNQAKTEQVTPWL